MTVRLAHLFIAVEVAVGIHSPHQAFMPARVIPAIGNGLPALDFVVQPRIVDIAIKRIKAIDDLAHKVAHGIVVEMRYVRPRYPSVVGVDDDDIGEIPGPADGHESGVEVLNERNVSHAHHAHDLGKAGNNALFSFFIHGRK